MYLKSLNIKGFKSFADKVTLGMEPGITAIVGPNGSGKSNISDAILWVLGERNARHLRGQAMEDVIFSGSSARRPAALAEVELVLDNGDKTLAVDYDDVSIARRIYRSGESEYLLNGAIVRRRDIHDILNDCGLGASVHSIISQGSLEEILQSSPVERRAMVEEAAGLLKHKQRRERATRKLETLGHHLVRVRDIAGMLKSQLRPLARKAQRYERYTALKEELDAILLALAVDDLRNLQQQSESLEAREQSLRTLLESQREALTTSDQSMEALQRQMRQKDDDTAERGRLARRFAAAGESLGGVGLVLQERKRENANRQADLAAQASTVRDQRARAERTLGATRDDLKQLELDFTLAEASLGQLREARDGARTRLADLEADAAARDEALKAEENAIAALRKRVAELNETLNEAKVRIAFIDTQSDELKSSLSDAVAEAETLATKVQAETESLQRLIADEKELGETIAHWARERDDARKTHDEAVAAQAAVASRYQIAEDRQRAWLNDSGAARRWLESKRTVFSGHLEALSDAFDVDPGYESLVESLLGADGAAMMIDGLGDVEPVASGLIEAGVDGTVSLVPRVDGAARPPASADDRDRLIDHVHGSGSNQRAVDALLGDIVLCSGLEEALSAHEADDRGRYATPSGDVVWPSGKVTLGVAPETSGEGPIQLRRALTDLKRERTQAAQRVEETARHCQAAEERLRQEEDRRRQLGDALATMRGRVATARSQAESAQVTLDKLRGQIDDLKAEREAAEQRINHTRPAIDEALSKEADCLSRIEELRSSAAKLSVTLGPLREESMTLNERLSEEAAVHATLAERRSHLRASLKSAETALSALDGDDRRHEGDAKRLCREASVLNELAERIEAIQALAIRDGKRLEAEERSTQETTRRLHEQWTSANEHAQALHDSYDQTLSSLADLRVEQSRLETSVTAIVATITDELDIGLEKAVTLGPLTDRVDAQQTRDRLQDQIARLGVINPDAMVEYRELSERYEYVDRQLRDLEGACEALRAITDVIDRRMTLDFERTFACVQENFLEIFTQLFPGGNAQLRLLEDEESDEGAGIEVTAQPRGKRITKMTLMSGGEKSLTALALLFAIYRVRRAPFYLLDEVEAALDDTNLRRLLAFLERAASETQLMMITHQRSTMEMADVLFGVTMQSDGVTHVVSQRLEKRGDRSRGAF